MLLSLDTSSVPLVPHKRRLKLCYHTERICIPYCKFIVQDSKLPLQLFSTNYRTSTVHTTVLFCTSYQIVCVQPMASARCSRRSWAHSAARSCSGTWTRRASSAPKRRRSRQARPTCALTSSISPIADASSRPPIRYATNAPPPPPRLPPPPACLLLLRCPNSVRVQS